MLKKIKRSKLIIAITILVTGCLLFLPAISQAAPLRRACDLPQSRYGLPTWYKYLDGQKDPADRSVCRLQFDFSVDAASSMVSIGLAVIEIMLFVAGIVAVAYIIYGGFRYVLSQGNPDATKGAKDAVLNAVIGLVIAISATTLVRFIAGRLG